MKLKKYQSGAVHIEAVLLVVLIVVIGIVGWKVWDNSKDKSSKENTSASQKDTNTPSNISDSSTTKQLVIPQWGVQFEIPSSIPDLKVDSFEEFPAKEHVASSVANLDSPALEAAGKIKKTGLQEIHQKLGYIQRQRSGTEYFPGTSIESYAKNAKLVGVTIGDYYYIYITTYASENAEMYTNAIKSSIETSLKGTN